MPPRNWTLSRCLEVFVQQLRERSFRLTLQREIILSVLHDIEGLATAEEI